MDRSLNLINFTREDEYKLIDSNFETPYGNSEGSLDIRMLNDEFYLHFDMDYRKISHELAILLVKEIMPDCIEEFYTQFGLKESVV